MKKIMIDQTEFFVQGKPVAGRDHSGFWNSVNKKHWEYQTFKLLARFLDKQHSYIDIGAWIGPTVLYGCQFARHCYALEPDLYAANELKSNMDLNPRLRGRISLFNNLIGDSCARVSFGTISQFGDSMSSTMFSQPTQTVTAQSITLEEFISVNEIKDCNFIKMDIEGSEVMVLPDIRDYLRANKPTLLLSLHPHLFRNIEEDSQTITGVLDSCYRYLYSDVGEPLTEKKIKDRLARNKGFTVLAVDREWPALQRATHFLEKLFFYISKKIKK